MATRTLPLLTAFAAALGALLTTSLASAQFAARTDAAPPAPHFSDRFEPHVFLGASGGLGLASVSHPDLATPHLIGPALALEGGYAPSQYYNFAFVLRHFEQAVTRSTTTGRLGAASSWLHTLADCNTCRGHDLGGGKVVATTFLLHSVGPRFDLTPFGEDGLFLGAAAGLGAATLVETRFGVAGSAHGGLQTTVAGGVVTLSAEAGVEGQKFADASAVLGYGTVAARFGF